MDTLLSNAAGVAALIVAVSGFAGLWWQRRIDQRKQDIERIVAARAAAEREEAAETERIRLINQIENERLASFKAELADLRAQLKAERAAAADLLQRLEKLEHENRILRMYGRKEDQERIAELEKRVETLERENHSLRGDK